MDRIELAVREYERIAPKAAVKWNDVPIRKIMVWLKDYVCPVVEQLAETAQFRKQARWPLEAISKTSLSPTASLVARVDRKLESAAKALLDVAHDVAVAEQIRLQNPPEKQIVRESVRISGEGSRREEAVVDEVDTLPMKEAQVRRIAEHAYADLACADDYFGPVGGLLPSEELNQIRKHANSSVTEASLVPSVNPELHLIGDFVTHSMLWRVEVWLDGLTTYRTLCYRAVRSADREAIDAAKAEATAWTELQEAVVELRAAFSTEHDIHLRDACIVLTQVYANFHPVPDLSWLGLPEPIIDRGRTSLTIPVETGRDLQVIDRIAAALGNVKEICTSPSDEVEWAVETGGLVIVKEPRTVYWEKKEITCSWDKHVAPFGLLVKLAEKARFGNAVEDTDLWDEPGAKSRLSNLKGRLGELIPPTLSRQIEAARPGVRLHVDAKAIYVIQSKY